MKIQINIKKEDFTNYLKLVNFNQQEINDMVFSEFKQNDVLEISDEAIKMASEKNNKIPYILQALAAVEILLRKHKEGQV